MSLRGYGGSNMNILHVIPYFTPKRGGDVNVCYNLSKQLVKHSHKVTIVTTDFEFDEEYAKSLNGIQVIPFKCNVNIGLFLISPSMKKWLKENIKNFDIVHLHDFRSYQNCIVHYYAKNFKIPYVLQAHGSLPRIIEKQKLKKLYDWIFGYKLLNEASKVIAVSKAEVEQYKQAGINGDKIVTVPNGIDIEGFKELQTYGNFREKYKIKEDHMILFLGRIHKRKGIDFLIKSFSDLRKDISGLVLVIIGSNDGYKVEVEKSIKTLNLGNIVKVIGYVDEKDKMSAYVDADVLVYPGIYEIFGLVPFEAILCGTPVIVTDDCGCGELVREANCGYLVNYNDRDGLKEKMRLAIENQEEGKELVARGKKYINDTLAWDKIVERVLKSYLEVLKRGGA